MNCLGVQACKAGETLANAATFFNIGKSTDHDKIKNEGKLQTFLTEVQDGDSIRKGELSGGLIMMNWTKLCFFDLSQRCKGKNCFSYCS